MKYSKNQYFIFVFSMLIVVMVSELTPRIGTDILLQLKKTSEQILAFHRTPFLGEKGTKISMEELILPTGEINCDKVLVKTKDGGNQKIETIKLTLIERGDYKYLITFMVEGSNVRAIFYSENGVALHKNDEIIFMDNTRQRRAFKFIGKGKKSEKSIRHNMLQMDYSAVTWMASHPIITIYIKNNLENRMMKFSIKASTQAKLKALLICLDNEFN